MSDPVNVDTLVETVLDGVVDGDQGRRARAALSDLAARAREGTLDAEDFKRAWEGERERAEAAEADRDRLRQELAEEREEHSATKEGANGWREFRDIERAERDRLARRVAELEAALRDMRALIVIDEDGAAEAIRMEDWGPVWIRGSELLAGDGGGA